jgi:hypothetical protein
MIGAPRGAGLIWIWPALLVMLAMRRVGAMGQWGVWDWIGFGSLWTGAIVMAFEGALAWAPRFREVVPRFFKSSFWAFVPLALLIISTAVLGARAVGWIGGPSKPAATPETISWSSEYKPAEVSNRHFRSEVVILDGFHYSNCTFDDVTFKYNGTTPIEFEHNIRELSP